MGMAVGKLQKVVVNDEKDIISQKIEKQGVYSPRSMYRWNTFKGVVCKRRKKLWSIFYETNVQVDASKAESFHGLLICYDSKQDYRSSSETKKMEGER